MLKLAPAAIVPEFQTFVSDVEVWLMLSLFFQVTVPPRCTLIGLGLKAFVVNEREPLTIETVIPEADTDVGDELLE